MPISSEGAYMESKDYFGYEVFSDGTILPPSGRKLNPFKTKKGYLFGMFREDGKWTTRSIHRVIARTWIPNPYNLSDVDHINGVRDDNRVENLRWLSHSDNIRHSYTSGNRDAKGAKNANSVYSEDQIRALCDLYSREPIYPTEASRRTGIRTITCAHVLRRKQWVDISKDYVWAQRPETRRYRRRSEAGSKREAPC